MSYLPYNNYYTVYTRLLLKGVVLVDTPHIYDGHSWADQPTASEGEFKQDGRLLLCLFQTVAVYYATCIFGCCHSSQLRPRPPTLKN